MSAGTCTCDVKPPQRSHAVARSISGYAIYLSRVDDSTTFDPACPYHGRNGTMVAQMRTGDSRG